MSEDVQDHINTRKIGGKVSAKPVNAETHESCHDCRKRSPNNYSGSIKSKIKIEQATGKKERTQLVYLPGGRMFRKHRKRAEIKPS